MTYNDPVSVLLNSYQIGDSQYIKDGSPLLAAHSIHNFYTNAYGGDYIKLLNGSWTPFFTGLTDKEVNYLAEYYKEQSIKDGASQQTKDLALYLEDISKNIEHLKESIPNNKELQNLLEKNGISIPELANEMKKAGITTPEQIENFVNQMSQFGQPEDPTQVPPQINQMWESL